MDRGCGRPAVAVFQGGGFPGAPGEEESTSLLLRSAIHDSRHTKEYHLAELQRIEAEEAERDARLNDAAERLAKGEPIEGLTELLLRAKAENAKVIEAKPNVFIADSAGNIAAPASPVESAPPTTESADGEKTPSANPEPVPAKPAPFDPDPPPVAAKQPAAAKQPKSSHPGANMPGFAEFLSERATHDADAERAKKVEAARARGQCQIPPSEAFPPDPREGPEISFDAKPPKRRSPAWVGCVSSQWVEILCRHGGRVDTVSVYPYHQGIGELDDGQSNQSTRRNAC